MFRIPTFVLAVFGWLVAAAPVTADHFSIDLEARTGKVKQTAHAETAGRDAKPKKRGVLEVKAGETITVHWTLRNADPKVTLENVTVHFFAAREEKVGQLALPRLDRSLVETAISMDFRPRDAAEGEASFIISQQGAYLIRLQTLASVEHPAAGSFAALDLVVR
jgi:hypothetical protein